jgi:DNA-3-methyladenine glycosylase
VTGRRRPLSASFYRRDTRVVAAELVGKVLWHGPVGVRITEVEAYCPGDTASHCRMGMTPRNAPMWGPPGHAYVYLCYGIHHMLNVVTDEDGVGAAVLIRAAEVIAGHDVVAARRGGKTGPDALTGPGKVAAGLELDVAFSGHRLFEAGGLTIVDGPRPTRLARGPRIGIDYATPADRAAAWRYADADSLAVARRGELTRTRWSRPSSP